MTMTNIIDRFVDYTLACEQALLGVLAARREKEGELTTTSLEFEYLYQKSRREMLIGGDGTSNDVITLGTCFSMFVYIRTRFRFALIDKNLTSQSTGSHERIGVEFKFQSKLSFLFPPHHQSAPESLLAGYDFSD